MSAFVDAELTFENAAEGGGPVTVSVSSQLMQNYATGSIIDGTNCRHLAAVTDASGGAIVLSLAADGHLYATRRDLKARTGWSSAILTAQFGDRKVEHFGVSQDAGGTITIYASLQGKNHLHYTTLPRAALSSAAPQAAWTQHSFVPPGKVTFLSVGTMAELAAEGRTQPVVIVFAHQGTGIGRWVLNLDGDGENAPFPHDVETVYAAVPAARVIRNRFYRGTYALYRTTAGETELSFVSEGASPQKVFFDGEALPANARAIAVAGGDPKRGHDLYVAGDGIERFPFGIEKERERV